MNVTNKTGVVVLTTSTAYDEVTAIGFSQLLGESVSTGNLDLSAYPGTYQIAEGFLLSIFSPDGRLFGQATGQGEFPLAPGREHEFSNVAADIRIVFSAFDDGSAKLLTLFQSRRETRAPRVSAEPPQVERKAIDIDATQLPDYEGRYELAPGVVITVESREAQLFAQVSGQMAYPVFAYDTDRFFYKVVDAQLQFERDPDGNVVAVILHQAGQTRAPRID
jgi:hypothetical protein